MSDLTKLTAGELCARTWLNPVSDEHTEISRRLERLEILEPLYAASESLRQQMNEQAVKGLIVFNQVRERLEKCEAALRKLALDLGPLGKIARAALEEK